MTPTLVKKKAIDVVPVGHAIWCKIGWSEPHLNVIVHRSWSEDGTKIVFLLDTFNFLFVAPDAEMEVVEVEIKHLSAEDVKQRLEADAEIMARRAPPTHWMAL